MGAKDFYYEVIAVKRPGYVYDLSGYHYLGRHNFPSGKWTPKERSSYLRKLWMK